MFNSLFNKSDESKRAKIDKIYQSQRSSFPGIQEITPEELQKMQSGNNLTIVDTRTNEEQEVSMLPGAITVEHFQAHQEQYRGSKIVMLMVTLCPTKGLPKMYTSMDLV